MMILSLYLVHPDAHLQDALIKVSNITSFLPPEVFQCFVLFKEFASVELLDTTQQ